MITRGQIGTGGNCWRHLQDVSLGLSLRGQIENKTIWTALKRLEREGLCVAVYVMHGETTQWLSVWKSCHVTVSSLCPECDVSWFDSCLVSSVWLVGEGQPCRYTQTYRAKFLSFACCLSFSALIFIRLWLAPHWKHRTLYCVPKTLVVCNTTNFMTNDPLAHNSCQSSPQKLQQSQTLQIYILIDYSLTVIGLLGLLLIPIWKSKNIQLLIYLPLTLF